jgi:hypothetical protein
VFARSPLVAPPTARTGLTDRGARPALGGVRRPRGRRRWSNEPPGARFFGPPVSLTDLLATIFTELLATRCSGLSAWQKHHIVERGTTSRVETRNGRPKVSFSCVAVRAILLDL